MNEYFVRIDGRDVYTRDSIPPGGGIGWQRVCAKTAEDAVEAVWQTRLAGSELAALSRLDEAVNEFLKLDPHHPDEGSDFRRAIRAARHIVMARAARNADTRGK